MLKNQTVNSLKYRYNCSTIRLKNFRDKRKFMLQTGCPSHADGREHGLRNLLNQTIGLEPLK